MSVGNEITGSYKHFNPSPKQLKKPKQWTLSDKFVPESPAAFFSLQFPSQISYKIFFIKILRYIWVEPGVFFVCVL